MTGTPRNPDEAQPSEPPQPGQQQQDSGGRDGAKGFMDGAQGFGNIDPSDGEDPPGGDEVGGG